MFKINNKGARTMLYVTMLFLLLTLNIFHAISSVFIVNCKPVNVYWESDTMENTMAFWYGSFNSMVAIFFSNIKE